MLSERFFLSASLYHPIVYLALPLKGHTFLYHRISYG